MHAEPEAAKRAAAAAGLLYPPAALFKEPDPEPSRPNAKEPGPDLSSFEEWAPPSSEKDRRSIADAGGMKRSGLSIGSQMWAWGSKTPAKTPTGSRESSAHGGNAFATGMKREGSIGMLARLGNWGGSRSTSPEAKPMRREGSIGARLWSWATEPGQPEVNQMRKAKEGPDLTTFDAQGRTFDAQGKTHSVLPPQAPLPTSPEDPKPRSADHTHTDRGV